MDGGTATGRRPRGHAREHGTLLDSLVPLSGGGGHAWFVAAVGVGALVVVAYLVTHGHPAYEGGLYVEMAEAIRANGFVLPNRIDGYTADGVPFAYPPLLFYAMAAVVATTGIDPVALELYLPGIVSIACLVPYYGVARRLLPTQEQAGLATMFYAVTPAVLQWHLSAGGVVRAPAMFLTLTGLYTGIRLFSDGGLRWLVASTALFALVLLAHPVYAAFFGFSYLVLYAGLDRSAGGLVDGAVVAVGGLFVTAPWWLTVIDAHGLEVFLGAAGTRTRIGGGVGRIVGQFLVPLGELDAITPFYVATFAGGIYAATRRRYLLPAWMVLSSYGLGEDRFTFVAGSMLSAMVVVEAVLPRVADRIQEADARRLAAGVALVILVGGAGVVGVAYSGSALSTVYENSTTMPQTVSPADREAMAWAGSNTPESAGFVVVGDAAEWFPHYADRTILVTPWGTEWTSAGQFQRHLQGYTNVSSCESAACLERSLRGIPGEAAFVYVPRREYTVRAKEHPPPDALLDSLDRSDRYERHFANEGVVIYEVVGSDETG